MALSTEQELRDFLGGIAGVKSARIAGVLETARRTVLREGIAEGHESFGDLQRLYAAHLLELSGVALGNVASRQIGDVSTSYAKGQSGFSFKDQYYILRTDVIGGLRVRFQ